MSEVGFANTPTGHRSLMMVNKTLEDLTRDQLWEELRVQNQSVSESKKPQQRLTSYLKEKGLHPAMEVFQGMDARSTSDPFTQILEKFTEVEIRVDRQHRHTLATVSTKTDQQQEHLAAISAKTNLQEEHLAIP